jgi:hypothetical protein
MDRTYRSASVAADGGHDFARVRRLVEGIHHTGRIEHVGNGSNRRWDGVLVNRFDEGFGHDDAQIPHAPKKLGDSLRGESGRQMPADLAGI